MECRANSKT